MALSGYEKAAIFLSSVGESVAAEILKGLDHKDIGKISMHMTRLKNINRANVENILKEVSEMLSRGGIHNGQEYLKNILSKGLGEDGATKILEMVSKESPLDSLKWISPKILSNFLVTEHPQTIALILCLLEPGQASEALSALPDTIKGEVAMRIATTERISESALEEIEEVLKGQMDIGKSKAKKLDGTKTIAEILNRCDRSIEEDIFKKIEEQNNVLAESIRQLMFVFDDIEKVDDKGIQMILKEVSTEDLSLALKTASDTLKEKIFKNMSQRAGQILKEDMETRGPVKVSDVESAQQNIVKVARKLEEEGKIIIAGRGKEELVV